MGKIGNISEKRKAIREVWLKVVFLFPLIFAGFWLLNTFISLKYFFHSCPPIEIEFWDYADFYAWHIIRNGLELDEELFIGLGIILWSIALSLNLAVWTSNKRKTFAWTKLYAFILLLMSIGVYFTAPIAQPWSMFLIGLTSGIYVVIFAVLIWKLQKSISAELEDENENKIEAEKMW